MKLKEAIVMQIAEGDIKALWKHFNLLDEEDFPEFHYDYEKIRFGYRIRFSIYDLWTDRVYIKGTTVHVRDPDTKQKMSYDLEDYRTEKTMREAQLRKRLYENMKVEGTLEGR